MNEFAEKIVDFLQNENAFIRDTAHSTLENIIPRINEKDIINAIYSSIDEKLRKNSFGDNLEVKNSLTKASEFVKYYQNRY